MRAIVLNDFGPPDVLVPTEVPDPVPGPGQVLIEVEVANIVFVETQVRAGRAPNPSMLPTLPAIPGNGGGGTVAGRRVISSTTPRRIGPTGSTTSMSSSTVSAARSVPRRSTSCAPAGASARSGWRAGRSPRCPSAKASPPKHFHPSQEERFDVTEGELHVHLDGELRVLHAGETLEIPRGVVHAMWAGGGTAVRAIWQVRPALRTEEFMAAMAAARGHHATPPVRTAIPLVRKYSDVFRLAGIAGLVQRV